MNTVDFYSICLIIISIFAAVLVVWRLTETSDLLNEKERLDIQRYDQRLKISAVKMKKNIREKTRSTINDWRRLK